MQNTHCWSQEAANVLTSLDLPTERVDVALQLSVIGDSEDVTRRRSHSFHLSLVWKSYSNSVDSGARLKEEKFSAIKEMCFIKHKALITCFAGITLRGEEAVLSNLSTWRFFCFFFKYRKQNSSPS